MLEVRVGLKLWPLGKPLNLKQRKPNQFGLGHFLSGSACLPQGASKKPALTPQMKTQPAKQFGGRGHIAGRKHKKNGVGIGSQEKKTLNRQPENGIQELAPGINLKILPLRRTRDSQFLGGISTGVVGQESKGAGARCGLR